MGSSFVIPEKPGIRETEECNRGSVCSLKGSFTDDVFEGTDMVILTPAGSWTAQWAELVGLAYIEEELPVSDRQRPIIRDAGITFVQHGE